VAVQTPRHRAAASGGKAQRQIGHAQVGDAAVEGAVVEGEQAQGKTAEQDGTHGGSIVRRARHDLGGFHPTLA